MANATQQPRVPAAALANCKLQRVDPKAPAASLASPPLQELEAVGAGPELDRMVAEFEASRKAKQAATSGRS